MLDSREGDDESSRLDFPLLQHFFLVLNFRNILKSQENTLRIGKIAGSAFAGRKQLEAAEER